MPRRPRCGVVALVATTALAGCTYSSGTLSSPTSSVPRPAASAPPTTAPEQGPVVGTLPPITQPGQTIAPVVTAPPETVPSTLPAVTVADEPVPTTRPARTSTTAAAVPTTVVAPSSTVAGTAVLGVQAGAYSDRAGADIGLAELAKKGFRGFTVSGSGPFRLVEVPLSADAADDLVAALADAGWPALRFTRKG